jgi:hypothetical protein
MLLMLNYKEINTHILCIILNLQQRGHQAFGASVFLMTRRSGSVTHSCERKPFLLHN